MKNYSSTFIEKNTSGAVWRGNKNIQKTFWLRQNNNYF
jgi:hypothetical protein